MAIRIVVNGSTVTPPSVGSVNGQTGDVELDHTDVGAPSTAELAAVAADVEELQEGGGGAGLHFGTTAPADPAAYPFWWDTTTGALKVYYNDGSSSQWVDAMPSVRGGTDYILLQDQKASGTTGGTFTSGGWQTRTLNTEVSDAAGWCSLASNQFTLLPGTYRILARAPALGVGPHQAKLYNVTDSTDIAIGTTAWNDTSTISQDYSVIMGRFTITATKVFEIRHQCAATKTSIGFGTSASFSVVNVFTTVELERERS